MFLFLALAPLVLSQLNERLAENSINMHTHFKHESNVCNVFDEANYCQQIVIDRRLTLAAVSHKCDCPAGYRCPNDVEDTLAVTQCEYDQVRHWHKCQMRCVPEEL